MTALYSLATDQRYQILRIAMLVTALLLAVQPVGCGDNAEAASCVSTCDQYGCVTICL